ncbi:MAG: helix-turn-helix transcriptional regulator [Bacteroidales bacterium]|jgi:transcriptional regulator with XRE-family HTH domain|nr:helix-turn-helix transcriptional regulator [Bacteroidales bacterium]
MDTIKIGNFLRELRKEKNLTQEQLADVFNVSARTVSRWETGSNMPDISILVEIADYYDLDVREILNGERSNALPAGSSSIKDIAEYADKDKEKLAVKTRLYAIAGIIGIITYLCFRAFGNPDSIIINLIASLSLVAVYAALASSLIYTSNRLQTLQRKLKMKLKKNLLLIILTLVIGIILLLLVVPLLLIGSI